MSSASKMRGRLAAMAKEREEFEKTRKALEVDMTNLKKGIISAPSSSQVSSSNDNDDTFQSSLNHPSSDTFNNDTSGSSSYQQQSPKIPRKTSVVARNLMAVLPNSNTGGSSTAAAQTKGGGTAAVLIPSGTRVSDWCFVSDISTSPPIVKPEAIGFIYETIRLLGRGAFGDVNLVKNIDDNKLYACKTIFCEKEDDLLDTLREIRFLRLNRHPCIIDIHDGFVLVKLGKNTLYIVMQYCEAGDLGKVISSTRKSKSTIPEAQIVKWVIQIGLALHFLHERGTIHRDLKPCNVMLTEGGDQAKLVDFGLALEIKESDDSDGGKIKEDKNEAGTPYYTSPEMIQNQSYTYPSDCWSFGIMLYELLSLSLPFHGDSTGDLVKAILTGTPQSPPSHYSDEILSICKALLIKDPAHRLGMAGMLCEPLLASKVTLYPQAYRPKALEERLRRAHVKQLSTQLESIKNSKKSSTTAAQICLQSLVTPVTPPTTESEAASQELIVSGSMPLIVQPIPAPASSALGVCSPNGVKDEHVPASLPPTLLPAVAKSPSLSSIGALVQLTSSSEKIVCYYDSTADDINEPECVTSPDAVHTDTTDTAGNNGDAPDAAVDSSDASSADVPITTALANPSLLPSRPIQPSPSSVPGGRIGQNIQSVKDIDKAITPPFLLESVVQ